MMPQNAFFSTNSRSSGQPKNDAKTLFFHPPSLSMVIFATATVLAFVLLRDSRCYTEHEETPIQKSARKCAATSRDFLHERLQSVFTLANQLRWIAQQFWNPVCTVTSSNQSSASSWLEVWHFLQVIWHALSLYWYDCTLDSSICLVNEITGKQEVFLDSELHSGLHLLSAGLKASSPESKALKLKILASVM